MFMRDFMIRTNYRPLKETPDVLYGIGMDITPDPFFGTVIDRLVPCVAVSDTLIRRPFIGIDSLRIRI